MANLLLILQGVPKNGTIENITDDDITNRNKCQEGKRGGEREAKSVERGRGELALAKPRAGTQGNSGELKRGRIKDGGGKRKDKRR
jgi:hypothetical protein